MNYRRIYEQFHGPIPRDNEGRSFDIHHIDGNRNNNDPSNLVALSKIEHYNIHLNQGDKGAALRLANELKIDPIIRSTLARESALARVEKGTHNFQNAANDHNKGKLLATNGIIKRFFFPDDIPIGWNKIVDKDRCKKPRQYHKGYKQTENWIQKRVDSYKKCYIVTDPNGNEITITGLNEFCRNHNLSPQNMSKVAAGSRSSHKGYQIRYT